ncbi:alpha/beta hydrolase, partial [Lactobacillus delbrueckii]|nr:alpha/beta hydrolase [Lactobacillus delbrueckii]
LAGRGHQVDLEIIPGHGHAMDYGREYLRESMTYLNYALSLKTRSE